MSEEYLVGKCSKCGEELRVPARLKEFSCMFCGAKLTPEDLVEELPPETAPTGDPAALKARVRRDLIRCVSDYPDINKQITRKEYEPVFLQYERECSGILEDLDLLCRLEPQRQAEHIAEAVETFLDQLEQGRAGKKTGRFSGQSMALDNDKMTVAVFMVPMIRHLKLPVSEPFCQALQQAWVARYPKSPFFLGSYEEISAGFRKKILGLCFITTAVCEAEGKPDDCAELTAFRAFRDGYLAACPDGPALIEEYYNVAPGIVTCINLCADREARYEAIRTTYLQPCYEDLLAGRNGACKDRYVRMVRDLERQYLS